MRGGFFQQIDVFLLCSPLLPLTLSVQKLSFKLELWHGGGTQTDFWGPGGGMGWFALFGIISFFFTMGM